jgi:hypothetical protein
VGGFASHQVRVAECAGQQCGALVPGEEVDGQVGRVSALATSRTNSLLAAHAAPHVAATSGFHRALAAGHIFLVATAFIAPRATNTRGEPTSEISGALVDDVTQDAAGSRSSRAFLGTGRRHERRAATMTQWREKAVPEGRPTGQKPSLTPWMNCGRQSPQVTSLARKCRPVP